MLTASAARRTAALRPSALPAGAARRASEARVVAASFAAWASRREVTPRAKACRRTAARASSLASANHWSCRHWLLTMRPVRQKAWMATAACLGLRSFPSVASVMCVRTRAAAARACRTWTLTNGKADEGGSTLGEGISKPVQHYTDWYRSEQHVPAPPPHTKCGRILPP